MSIVVTGHMGFIGSYLMKELPEDTIGLDIKDGNDILECDLPEADVVIHLAAEAGVLKSMEDPYANARTNILGTIRLLQRYPKAQFIFASSGGTIQETIESPYGLSKKTCEEYIRLLSNFPVILRFANVYGPGSRSVVDKFLTGPIDIYGSGEQNRTYAHVDDIVRAIKASITQIWPPGLYKLGGNQNYSVNQIAEAIGKPVTYSKARKGELLNSELPNETPDWYTTIELMEYIEDVIRSNS